MHCINNTYLSQVVDFKIPPLSIQPLVENSIKHGILQKLDGGTVIIKSYENESSYIVEIIDDGVGFNVDAYNFKDNNHIGLNNIGFRIKKMCNGDIKINSKINEGTHVVVTFSKERLS